MAVTKNAAARVAAAQSARRKAGPASRPKKPASKELGDPPEEKKFFSPDGEDIRVEHPDGSVALVTEDPRSLPKKLWRLAVKQGCHTTTRVTREEFAEGEIGLDADAFTRMQAIKDAMIAALQADDEDPRFADAFNRFDIPEVRWLEKRVGFPISADERDAAWREVQKVIPELDDEDEDGAGDAAGDEDNDAAGDANGSERNTGGE